MNSESTLVEKPPEEKRPRWWATLPALALYRLVRRLVVFVIGMTVVLVGVVMIVTPGPAIVVIPLGLAILATEFVWARIILNSVKRRMLSMRNAMQAGPPTTEETNRSHKSNAGEPQPVGESPRSSFGEPVA